MSGTGTQWATVPSLFTIDSSIEKQEGFLPEEIKIKMVGFSNKKASTRHFKKVLKTTSMKMGNQTGIDKISHWSFNT